jgi:hypothetical protein
MHTAIPLNYRVQEKKYNYQFGFGVQNATQESQSFQASTGKDSMFTRSYTNIFPNVALNLTPEPYKKFPYTL